MRHHPYTGATGQERTFDGDPHSSHTAWSSMQAEICAMQGFRENLVDEITSQLAEPIDKNSICLTCVPGYAASHLPNPAKLLPI